MINYRHLLLVSVAVMMTACGEDDEKVNSDVNTGIPQVCKESSKQCDNNGVPEICTDGSWQKLEACDSDEQCKDGDCVILNTKECNNDAKQCSKKGIPQVCINETWKDSQPCGDKQICRDGDCVSIVKPKCQNDEKRCMRGIPEKCEDGSWVKQSECGNNQKCFYGDCVLDSVPECDDGERQCDSYGIPQICQNRRWQSLDACKSDEICNKKAGECVLNDECTNAKCKAMNAEQYQGNVCINSDLGEICGCHDDDDCNEGYKCDQSEEVCRKPATDTTSSGTGVCLGHSSGSVCNRSSIVRCSAEGVEISSESCDSITGAAYMGDACIITNGNQAACGCNSNSDCKAGYECASNHQCAKKPCSEKECAGRRGSKYIGNACVDSYIQNEKECGCRSDDDCKEGFVCNTAMMRCKEADPETPKTICGDQPTGSFVCQNDQLIFCDYGYESVRFNCRSMEDGSYLGNKCIDNTGTCGCYNDYDCKDNLICEDNFCVKPPCRDSSCAKQTGNAYLGNICVDDYIGITSNDKTCGCLSDSDCKSGYKCHSTMGICYIPPSPPAAELCQNAEDNAYLCDGNDVVLCDDKAVYARWTCANATNSYLGNTCLSEYDFCGCRTDSDCNIGMKCGADDFCVPASCSPAACKAQSEADYLGNTCVSGWYEGTEVCGCASNDDCNADYECNSFMGICVKKAVGPEYGFCYDKPDTLSSYCDGNDLVFCNYGEEFSRDACSTMTGTEYMGNICLEEYDYCGCRMDPDCQSGYECIENMCTKMSCYAPECIDAPDADYAGDACVDSNVPGKKACGCTSNADCRDRFECNPSTMRCEKLDCYEPDCRDEAEDDYLGDACIDAYDTKMCGCQTNEDCRSGYECNPTMLVCIKSEGTPGICEGKPNDTHLCDGNTVVYCSNNRIETRYDCNAESSSPNGFVGSVCIKDTGVCGCKTNRDCASSDGSYKCTNNECVKRCFADECKEQSGTSAYKGNICVDVPGGRLGEKDCGCTTHTDCEDGFVCDNNVCVSSGCSEASCRASADNYKGESCVMNGSGSNKWNCGCNDNSDCKEGYSCDLTTMTCTKLPETNVCLTNNDAHFCDNNTRMYCVNHQLLGDDEPCNLKVGDDYKGSICIESTGDCGCNDQSDCKEGFECRDGICEREAFNPCKNISAATNLCDGNELVLCENGVAIKRINCASMTTTGSVCTQSQADNKYICGCNSDADCYRTLKCSSSNTCISASLEFKKVERLTCDYIKKENKNIISCSERNGIFTLEDKFENKIELNLNTNKQYHYNMSKTGTHYMKFTNVTSGALVLIVWEFDSSEHNPGKVNNNFLKVSDGNNVQSYNGTIYGDNSIQFRMGSTSKTLIIEHDGSGTDAVVVKSVIIM